MRVGRGPKRGIYQIEARAARYVAASENNVIGKAIRDHLFRIEDAFWKADAETASRTQANFEAKLAGLQRTADEGVATLRSTELAPPACGPRTKPSGTTWRRWERGSATSRRRTPSRGPGRDVDGNPRITASSGRDATHGGVDGRQADDTK